jgi:RNase P/RNase MRP subunit POP5
LFWRVYPIIKEGRRRRYIGFIMKDTLKPIPRKQFIHTLNHQCQFLFLKKCYSMGITLIQFNGKAGIIRCPLAQKQNTIHLLYSVKKIGVEKTEITTVGTSGTIKSLKKKHLCNILI